MPKVAFIVVLALFAVAIGALVRSDDATADIPMGDAAALDIQALQAAAAKDLPVMAGDNAF